jgi:hypothetical protein
VEQAFLAQRVRQLELDGGRCGNANAVSVIFPASKQAI